MKTTQELLNERYQRLTSAITLGKNDRVPVVASEDAFAANHMGMTLAEYLVDIAHTSEVIAQSADSLGVDASLYTVTTAPMLGAIWLSDVKLPGRELGANDLWQTHEVCLMEESDYDSIINKGFNAFFADWLQNRVPQSGTDAQRAFSADPIKAKECFESKGLVPFAPAASFLPYDMFCGGRGIVHFMRDLFKIPDKVQAAMDVAMIDILENLRNQIRQIKPFAVFLGVARAAGPFVSPKIFNRFSFPYLKQIVETAVDEGAFAYLHCDQNWERDLDRLLELPKGKCIFASDHTTDLYKAKKGSGRPYVPDG